MTGWDIDPEGVQGVLEAAGERASDLEGWGEHYGSTLESAAAAAGTLSFGGGGGGGGGGEGEGVGLVGLALSQFAENTRGDVMYIGARIGKSLEGAYNAAVAYLEGDEAMAAEAQRLALLAPVLDLRAPGEDPNGPV
ncbi:DUF6507 family protein [Streptomyces xiamenensis]